MAKEQYELTIPYFLNNVLNTPAGSLPKGAQWIVTFDNLAEHILPGIRLALTQEKKQWAIQEAANVVTSEAFQKSSGCIYCQAIDLPGESLVVNPEGNIMSNAFLRSYVGGGRNQYPQMRMTFLDTNVSFCENFLRPWVIATGAFGLIARDRLDTKNYRTNLTCYKLGSYAPAEKPEILMKMTFYDICCVSVSDEAYTYQPVVGSPPVREAQFVFNYYSIETDKARIFFDLSNPNLATPFKKDKTDYSAGLDEKFEQVVTGMDIKKQLTTKTFSASANRDRTDYSTGFDNKSTEFANNSTVKNQLGLV